MGRLIDVDEFEKRIKPYDTEDDIDKALYNFAHYHLVTTPTAQSEPCEDTISRKAGRMTREEAIETLKANYPDACFEQLRDAVDAAIYALKQPEIIRCKDCVHHIDGFFWQTGKSSHKWQRSLCKRV